MADKDQRQSDRELDAALAKYAAVEPRMGLEERILASLRAEREKISSHAWWRWSVAVALATVVVAALVVGWRTQWASRAMVVKPLSASTPTNEPQTKVATKHGAPSAAVQVSKPATSIRRPQSTAVAAANPKLDQFPSPQPLSEQEKILASYTAQFHQQAVLIAKVANEELQRDRAELVEKPQSPSDSAGHEHQENTNR